MTKSYPHNYSGFNMRKGAVRGHKIPKTIKHGYQVAIIGNGYVGKAYGKVFPDAMVYDEPLAYFRDHNGTEQTLDETNRHEIRNIVNACDMAIVAVPTDLGDDGRLRTDIVEKVVKWLETDLILIKSALMPGTTDRLARRFKKRIAVSVEMAGEGKYFIPYWKYPHPEDPRYHQFIVVGGEGPVATACAEILWSRLSPDVNIHITSAIEAEITKLMENTWGALKVSFANTIYDYCQRKDANYIKVLQAWGSDGRTEKMHMRVVENKRGWDSKCWNKDVVALAKVTRSPLLLSMLKVNERHRASNENN